MSRLLFCVFRRYSFLYWPRRGVTGPAGLGARMRIDWYALLGNVIALWAGLLVLGTLLGIACTAAWSHQAAHAALAGWR